MAAQDATTELRKLRDQAGASASRLGDEAEAIASRTASEARAGAGRLAEDAWDELARLRAQVQELTASRVTAPLSAAAGQALDYAHRARDAVEHQADSLSEAVRERPLVSVGIAALGGYLLGWLVSGRGGSAHRR